MTIDEGLNQLAAMQYPHRVDVVDGVMAQVRQHPYLQPVHSTNTWRRVAMSSAAAVLLVVVVGGVVARVQASGDDGIGSMIAQVQDYNYYGTVEEAAVNPIEYIYEE